MHQPTPSAHLDAATAESWLQLAMRNILQEYPHVEISVTASDADYRPHRQHHPTFFGSLDWHSCVEMYWVAARLLRLYPGLPSESEAIAVIDRLLTPENIATEKAFLADHPSFERPYGWGWLLKLQHELDISCSEIGGRWASALQPLSDRIAAAFKAWLPKMTYPQRIGMHANSAFALVLSWPYASASDGSLESLIRDRTQAWFAEDAHYPFAYEPSGADFLSAGLCEAVLMQRVLSPEALAAWIAGFLPAADREWLSPAIVSDPTDGQIAHLHGLNLSRAWALGELAAVLPERAAELTAMRNRHIAASIDAVAGSHYMVEHWVVAYALLIFTEPS